MHDGIWDDGRSKEKGNPKISIQYRLWQAQQQRIGHPYLGGCIRVCVCGVSFLRLLALEFLGERKKERKKERAAQEQVAY